MGVWDRLLGRRKSDAKIKKRVYAANNVGRLFADFVTMQKSADAEIRPALRRVRDRCRDVARNNDYARRYLQLLTTNVVGSQGVKVQVRGRNSDGALDAPGNAIIERQWREWGKRGVCTRDGRLSWIDAQRVFCDTLARDGEVLVELIEMPSHPHGFAIHFVEADYLDEQMNETLRNGNEVRMGVEMDAFGKVVAYHLLLEHPGKDFNIEAKTTRRRRVLADQILHCFLPDRPGQSRGMPLMATALTRLKMLDAYEEAELVAARVAASKMGFFTSPDGDGYTGSDMEDGRAPIMEAQPGTFEQLPAGMDFKTFDPEHPVSAFAEFEKAVLRGIASGLGVSYVSLANNLEGVNYSSIRQGVMEDRDHFKMIQTFMVEHFIEPVFRKWLTQAMTTGAVPIPFTKYDKFADNLVFRPRGWGWIDPMKEMQAHVVGLQNGITTLQDVATHQGRDVEEVFEQIEAERELAATYGITMAFEPFGQKSPATPLVEGQTQQ